MKPRNNERMDAGVDDQVESYRPVDNQWDVYSVWSQHHVHFDGLRPIQLTVWSQHHVHFDGLRPIQLTDPSGQTVHSTSQMRNGHI